MCVACARSAGLPSLKRTRGRNQFIAPLDRIDKVWLQLAKIARGVPHGFLPGRAPCVVEHRRLLLHKTQRRRTLSTCPHEAHGSRVVWIVYERTPIVATFVQQLQSYVMSSLRMLLATRSMDLRLLLAERHAPCAGSVRPSALSIYVTGILARFAARGGTGSPRTAGSRRLSPLGLPGTPATPGRTMDTVGRGRTR